MSRQMESKRRRLRPTQEQGADGRDRALRVIQMLEDGCRHRDALMAERMTWREFCRIVQSHGDLEDRYGPIDRAITHGASLGFASASHLIGHKYRAVLPQIAEPQNIGDLGLMGQAMEIASLLKDWIREVEHQHRRLTES